jgi:integrase
MHSVPLLDCAGRRRSPATLSGFHRGQPPRNRGLRYPPDPPTVEEIVAVMRIAGNGPDGLRLRGVITVLWRAGLRISEALALAECDLDPTRGAVLVRRRKGGKRREVGMDRWAWEQLDPWLMIRATLPVGALFCVLRGPTRGRPCSAESGPSCVMRRVRPGSVADLRLISCDTRTPWRCPAKGCRWSSSNGSSGTPISGSPPLICAGSTTPRSSTPSTNDPHH